MCDPTSIAVIGFGLNVAGQYSQLQAQKAQYQAQTQQYVAERTRYEQATRAAAESLANQTAQENLRLRQEHAAGVQKQLELYREAARVKGTIVAASEGGGGLSEELLLTNVDRETGRYNDVIAANMENLEQQSMWNKAGMAAEATNRANASMPTSSAPIAPSSASFLLGTAQSGLALYDTLSISNPNSGGLGSAGGGK